VIKTDKDGNILWDKTYGGTGIDIATSIIQTSDSDYTIAGITSSKGLVRKILVIRQIKMGIYYG